MMESIRSDHIEPNLVTLRPKLRIEHQDSISRVPVLGDKEGVRGMKVEVEETRD